MIKPSVRVDVFHNNRFPYTSDRGYRPGDSLTHVFSYQAPRFAGWRRRDDSSLLAEAFMLLNEGDGYLFGEPDEREVRYRLPGNRSLSSSDVVAVNGRFYSCDPRGWSRLATEPVVEQKRLHGSTPLDPRSVVRFVPVRLSALRRAASGLAFHGRRLLRRS